MTLSNLEDEEMDYVEELRERLKGIMDKKMHDDTAMFQRFLRARNYDIKATEIMLRNHVNWRKIYKVDTILSWYTPLEVCEKYVSFNKIGHDKEGSPILYINFGNLDTRGLCKCLAYSHYHDFCVHRLETDVEDMRVQSEKRNTTVDQMVFILNFENFPLSTATHKQTLEIVGKLISMYEANYPERLKIAFLVNASWYFTIGFAVIKPLLSGPTLQKVKLFGKDGYKEELLNWIDADVLPAFLGGNRTDPDGNPMCRSILAPGGPVPEKFYAINNKEEFLGKPGVKKIVVNRLSKVQIDVHILYPDSDLEWEFETTKGRDIAFSLLYKEKGSILECEELVPKQKIDTSVYTEVGIYKCEKPGLYILEFDNSFSWIHSKEVHYKIQVVPPVNKNRSA